MATETVPQGSSIKRKATLPTCGNARKCAELLHLRFYFPGAGVSCVCWPRPGDLRYKCANTRTPPSTCFAGTATTSSPMR